MKKMILGRHTGWLLLLCGLLVLASCGSRRHLVPVENGWEFLGGRKVNFVRDVDEINVNSPDLFTALQFRVQNRDLRLNRLKVYFQNGDVLEPHINENYVAGEESHIIELGSQGRAITRIEFRYRTEGKVLKGRSEVLVYGKLYEPRPNY